VSLDWRTGQAPFTVDIEMPADFEQLALITTDERHVEVTGIPWLLTGAQTSGPHSYTVTYRVRDAVGQVLEVTTAPFSWDTDIIPPPVQGP
jgi:hypothetical protein